MRINFLIAGFITAIIMSPLSYGDEESKAPEASRAVASLPASVAVVEEEFLKLPSEWDLKETHPLLTVFPKLQDVDWLTVLLEMRQEQLRDSRVTSHPIKLPVVIEVPDFPLKGCEEDWKKVNELQEEHPLFNYTIQRLIFADICSSYEESTEDFTIAREIFSAWYFFGKDLFTSLGGITKEYEWIKYRYDTAIELDKELQKRVEDYKQKGGKGL